MEIVFLSKRILIQGQQWRRHIKNGKIIAMEHLFNDEQTFLACETGTVLSLLEMNASTAPQLLQL